MTASHSPAASETPTRFDYLLNAFEQASQADEPAKLGYGDKRKALFAYVRDLEARAAAPSVESDPAPAADYHVAIGGGCVEGCPHPSHRTPAPVAGIDVEATALAALLRDCADDREQEAHDSLAHTPEAFESFMADARRLRAHADALPLLVSGQADTGRLDWLEIQVQERERVDLNFTDAWTEHGDYGSILSSGPLEFWLRDDGQECGPTLRAAIDAAIAASPTQTEAP